MAKENKKNSSTTKVAEDKMQKIVSLCKRRGFIFPCCEIYGGFANAYTYGPYGVELKNNIKKLWWKMFVQEREEIIGIDGPILLHPMLWEASGHTEGFNDALVDCKECKFRFRADHLVKEATGRDLEGNPEAMSRILLEEKIRCPNCGQSNWTEARLMNMMFETAMNSIEGPVYLRPETAGAIFVEFNNIIDAMHPPLPFGIAQIGKAFRNEIVARNFIFRIREFEQMEIEYFIHPQADWEKIFYFWLAKQEDFALAVGVKKEELRRFEHPKEKLAHYSKKTIDVEYNFPFGWGELYGLAQRSNFDLTQHAKYSKKKLEYTDPKTNEKFVPHVIEPTFGLDRTILVALLSAYAEEQVADGERVVLKLPLSIVPVQVAIFPLLKNKPQLVEKAKSIFVELKNKYMCEFDDNGNIGKRYRRQDEIGTPFCVTVDFDSLENGDVTVRDRDSMKQERVKIAELKNYFEKKFER